MIDKYQVILLSAGKGERMHLPLNKVFCDICKGKTVIDYSLKLFLNDTRCGKVVVVYNENDEVIVNKVLEKYKNYDKIVLTVGGITRQESVLNGLEFVDSEYVLVHDGARPNINISLVDRLLSGLEGYDSCSLGCEVTDTIKKVSNKIETINRNDLYFVQTPQGSKKEVLIQALRYLNENKTIVTDDLEAIEKFGDFKINIVLGDKNNIKVTTQEDLELIKYLLEKKYD